LPKIIDSTDFWPLKVPT